MRSSIPIYLIFLFILSAGVLNAQLRDKKVDLSNEEGTAAVEIAVHQSGIVKRISEVTIEGTLPEEVNYLQSYKGNDIYLHLADTDTALLARINGEDYYVYHTVSDMDEEETASSLKCLYSRIIYPAHARTRKVEGTVIIQMQIDEEGCASNIEAISDVGYGLEKAGVRAAKKCDCEFTPVTFLGNPVKAFLRIPLAFKIEG